MGKKPQDVPTIVHTIPCAVCVRHGIVCCGPALRMCAECKWTKSKCDKSRGKAKAALDKKGKAPGKLYNSSPAFLDSSAHATKVHTTRRQKDPSLFKLSNSDNMEMESPVTQGKRKAEPHKTQKAKSPIKLPHTAGFHQVCANIWTLHVTDPH
jgi:hypothetical protein